MWNTLLIEPLTNLLLWFYYNLDANMGFAIIGLTLFLRTLLIPLNIPSIKASIKQKKLAPELEKLKKQYGKDKAGYAKAQMALMKRHGVNPIAGCLPQIPQLLILFAMYRVFLDVLGGDSINTKFLYLDLGLPDPYVILPLLAGAGQFLTTKLMMPGVKKGEKIAEETSDKKDDLAYNMQKQSLYLFPIMTVVIGYKLPSGLALYWMITTVFSLIQQLALQKHYGRKEQN
jgi:YidC/Oxa1 family membrane protein insertase